MITGDFTFNEVSVEDDTSLNYEDKPQSTRTYPDEGGLTLIDLIINGIVLIVIIALMSCW